MFGNRRNGRLVPGHVAAGALALVLAAVPLWLAFTTDAGAQDRELRVYPGNSGYLLVGDVSPSAAWLGVHIEEEIEHPDGGARVTRVVEDSPAEAAGFRVGDLIVEFDGRTVRGPGGLRHRVAEVGPGRTVGIAVLRDGVRTELEAELAERPAFGRREFDEGLREEMELRRESMDEFRSQMHRLHLEQAACADDDCPRLLVRWPGKPLLGIEPVQTTPELRLHLGGTEDTGVLVGKLLPEMPAGEAGVQVGDLIVAIDGAEVQGTSSIRRALRDKDGETVRLELIRDGSPLTIDVALPEADEESGPRGIYLRSAERAAARDYARALAESARERARGQRELRETEREAERLYDRERDEAIREQQRILREEVRRSRVTLL